MRVELTVVFQCEVPDESDLASITLLGEYADFETLDNNGNWGSVISFETIHEEVVDESV